MLSMRQTLEYASSTSHSLMQVINVYEEAFSQVMPSQFINAISITIDDILSVCTLANDKLDKNQEELSVSYHHVVRLVDLIILVYRLEGHS